MAEHGDPHLTTTPEYPRGWEADVVLRDGAPMRIRPIRPSDQAALRELHRGQSPRSQYLRFFGPMAEISDRDLEYFTNVDHDERVAFVLTRGDRIVAVGRYDTVAPGEAEVAFYVADAEHGRGLGSVLLDHLAAAARERGLRRFVAEVLPGNRAMIRVLRDAGYEVSQEFEDGVVRVELDLALTPRSWTVIAEREQYAESRSMRALLDPASVVLLNLGGPWGALASRIAHAVAGSDFSGPIHLIGEVPQRVPPGWSHHAKVPAAAQAGATADLALVVGDPDEVVAAVSELPQLGVQGVVVLSGGFAEAGEQGALLQARLVAATRGGGMRLLGPMSFGVVAAGSHGRLVATLRVDPPAGTLGVFSQSALSSAMLVDALAERGIGIRSFVSAGNRADVSGNDTMQSWHDDEGVAVAALNLESIGNPRKFSRIARRLAATRPVVVNVSGLTGQLTPPGHAVRTSHQPQRVLSQMLEQAGVVRAHSVQHFLDLTQLFAAQPLPAGPRVAVLSSSATVTAIVRAEATARNLQPVEVTELPPLASHRDYQAALAALAHRLDWDALVVIATTMTGEWDSELAAVIAHAPTTRPVLAVMPGPSGVHDELRVPGSKRVVPAFATPSQALDALAGAVGYSQWRSSDPGELLEPVAEAEPAARELIAPLMRTLAPGESLRLPDSSVAELLAKYGIDVVAALTVADEHEAVAAAEQLGWPVALKARDEILRHRADLGAVKLDLHTPEQLREAWHTMVEELAAVGRGVRRFEVQTMVPPGVACVVRGTEDDLYGPVVAFGLGGDAVELLDDVAYRIPPLHQRDVSDMIASVKAAPRLFGHRGLPVLDTDALADIVARLAQLTDDLAEVREITLNPVLVARQGARVLSARVVLAQPWRTDTSRRTLSANLVTGAKMERWQTET